MIVTKIEVHSNVNVNNPVLQDRDYIYNTKIIDGYVNM